MKKILIIMAIFSFVLLPLKVNAGISNLINCEDATVDSSNKPIRTCYLNIKVTNTTKIYKIEGKLNFNNSSFKSIELLDNRFNLISNNPDNLIFVSPNGISNETISLAKITIYIGLDGSECNATWQPTAYGLNYSCTTADDNYYDKNGNITDYNKYNKECNVHSCEVIDNDYFGKDGIIVDEKTYNKECKSHSCEIIDNEYYDKDGNIVSEKQYNKSCSNYKCTVVDGEYYNSLGSIISEKEYNKECGKYSCTIIDNEYFDDAGKKVDKDTWESICTTPENPTTGSESLITITVIGIIALAFIIVLSKKTNTLYKI